MLRIKAKTQTTEVIVVSESEEEISLAAAETFSKTKLQPGHDGGKARDAKIASIFLRTKQQSLTKRISHDGEKDQTQKKPEPLVPHPPLPQSPASGAAKEVEEECVYYSPFRGNLSLSSLHSFLQDLQTSNSAFPVPAVFTSLQRKAAEGLRDAEHDLQSHFREKRKRGNDTSPRVPKRLRCSRTAEGVGDMGHCHPSAQLGQKSPVDPVKEQQKKRKSNLSRSRRLQLQTKSLVNVCEKTSGLKDHTELEIQSMKNSESRQGVSHCEDSLWTDKYSPQHSREIIGNSASVNKLRSWLKRWKLRADRDEKRIMEERKREGNSNDSWDCGDFQGEAGGSEDEGEASLCNIKLLTGPSGVGKTASVCACAQELGFKIFEVNCSSQRSGRHVFSQLKEATQSHLVEISGKDVLKPAYINNYNTPKSEGLPGKSIFSKSVTSVSKRKAAQTLGSSARKGRAKPATVTLAHYFKMKAKADHLHSGGLSASERSDDKKLADSSVRSDQIGPQIKKKATSLILFEEVDVIFDDDVGFLAAIKSFMSTTKRPIIMTTNDPSFRERFDCSVEEIIFKTPSAVDACSYLQLVCLAEGVKMDSEDVGFLLRLTRGDIRRSLLQLQLWVDGGGTSQSGNFSKKPNCALRGDSSEFLLLPGVCADMLGLQSVTWKDVVSLLKSWSDADVSNLLNVLAESWRSGKPLLYSNLELLLGTVTLAGPQKEPPPSNMALHLQQKNLKRSPTVSEHSSKSVRKISKLSRRKNIQKVTNVTPFSNCFNPKPRGLSSSFSESHSRIVSLSAKTKGNVSADGLEALADFFDLMSFLDASLPTAGLPGFGSAEAFIWTGAEVKDSLLDEMSEEEAGNWNQERLRLGIQAAVEGLGAHRCWWRVCETWTGALRSRQELEEGNWRRLMERLALSGSAKKQRFGFSFHPLRDPSVSQRRQKLSRSVLSSKSFSLLGNREAVCVDYMPVLRSIWRSRTTQQEKGDLIRCSNYFSEKHLGISQSTLRRLAEDFPEKNIRTDR